MDALPRVRTTAAARALVAALRARHGAILFYQSHGCCAGSAPMCFAERELALGPGDSGSFGPEDGSGRHVIAHFRLWTDEEVARLAPMAHAPLYR